MTFDWATFAFQIVNVLVLLAVLRHFLFRPVARVIAERRAETERALERAEAARREAEAKAEAARADAEASAARRAELIAKAEADAGAAREAVLKKARDEAAGLLAAARDEAAAIRAKAEDAATDRARTLALAIAGRLMDDMPDDRRVAGYARRLADALRRTPAETRDRLLAGGVRLVAARPLGDAEIAEAREALSAWGLSEIPVETDPALIAGLELRGANGVVRNSVAHDLTRVARALEADDRAVA